MRMTSKIALATATVTALIGAKGNIGYNSELSGNTVYGTATPVSFTEKYVAGWIGDVTASVARTDKWYTHDESETWTVWTFEICKGEDDAWFTIEFGM